MNSFTSIQLNIQRLQFPIFIILSSDGGHTNVYVRVYTNTYTLIYIGTRNPSLKIKQVPLKIPESSGLSSTRARFTSGPSKGSETSNSSAGASSSGSAFRSVTWSALGLVGSGAWGSESSSLRLWSDGAAGLTSAATTSSSAIEFTEAPNYHQIENRGSVVRGSEITGMTSRERVWLVAEGGEILGFCKEGYGPGGWAFGSFLSRLFLLCFQA